MEYELCNRECAIKDRNWLSYAKKMQTSHGRKRSGPNCSNQVIGYSRMIHYSIFKGEQLSEHSGISRSHDVFGSVVIVGL
jgi:hypothetical protein